MIKLELSFQYYFCKFSFLTAEEKPVHLSFSPVNQYGNKTGDRVFVSSAEETIQRRKGCLSESHKRRSTNMQMAGGVERCAKNGLDERTIKRIHKNGKVEFISQSLINTMNCSKSIRTKTVAFAGCRGARWQW